MSDNDLKERLDKAAAEFKKLRKRIDAIEAWTRERAEWEQTTYKLVTHFVWRCDQLLQRFEKLDEYQQSFAHHERRLSHYERDIKDAVQAFHEIIDQKERGSNGNETSGKDSDQSQGRVPPSP